jgi:hypothetical protein
LFYRSHLAYKVRKFIDTDVPSTLFWIYSRLPLLGSQDLQKKADLWKKVASQSAKAGDAFLHFMTNEWIYDATTCSALDRVTVDSYTSHRQNLKVPEFVNEFGLQDQTFYDWEYYWRYFAYGMQKWVLKEEVSEPTELWRTCMIESETSRLGVLRTTVGSFLRCFLTYLGRTKTTRLMSVSSRLCLCEHRKKLPRKC